MSPAKSSITHPIRPFTRPAALLFIGLSLLLAQAGGQAQVPARPPLKLFKNFFLSGGDYVVGGVGLRGQGDPTTQLATGTIQLAGVPGNGDISAAFLYWASLEHNDSAPMSADGYFNGSEIHGKVIGPNVRVPGCWGSGGGAGTSSLTTQLRVYRADVLRYLPVSTEPATLGKLIVNGVHQVKLPDSGGGGTQAPSSGNQVRYVEGASLVVVYRVPVPNAPLRAVVIYDGGVTVDQDFPSMNLNIGGYYDASASPAAKMTHLVGNGDIWPDTLTINGTVVGGSNPFAGTLGSAWDNPTYKRARVRVRHGGVHGCHVPVVGDRLLVVDRRRVQHRRAGHRRGRPAGQSGGRVCGRSSWRAGAAKFPPHGCQYRQSRISLSSSGSSRRAGGLRRARWVHTTTGRPPTLSPWLGRRSRRPG